MISVDELRAAGALEVPKQWRKSLRVEQAFLLFGEEDAASETQPTDDADDNGSAEDGS